MVDGVNAGNCIEAGVGKWQWGGGIGDVKFNQMGHAPLGCKGICVRNRLFLHVNADEGTARGFDDANRGATGAACDIEQDLAGSKVKPAHKRVLLARGEPTILANIQAKSLATNLRIEFRLEVSVAGVVVTSRRVDHAFACSVHGKPPRIRCGIVRRYCPYVRSPSGSR